MVSADLPFAQQHFCSVENTHNVQTLSMMRDRNFARDYGVLLLDGLYQGISARAIVVIDESDKVCTPSWCRRSGRSRTTNRRWPR